MTTVLNFLPTPQQKASSGEMYVVKGQASTPPPQIRVETYAQFSSLMYLAHLKRS
jgi:hypothetical protein